MTEYLYIVYDEIIHETDLAYLLSFDGEEKWVPKSVIKDGDLSLLENGDEIFIEKWFCKKEGLEEYEI